MILPMVVFFLCTSTNNVVQPVAASRGDDTQQDSMALVKNKGSLRFSNSFLALQLADTSGNPLELSLSLLPAPQRGDDQIAVQLLAHHQVGGVDVIHLLADTLQAVLEPQHRLPQVALRHAVQLVDGLALGLWHDLRVAVDV